MGVVVSVKPGEDGHVRTVSIRYTNPGKTSEEQSPPKITTRPIHKIAVIVPVDYVFEDDRGPEPDGPELPAPTEASAPEEAAPTQPDPAGEGNAQLVPGKETSTAEAERAPGGPTEKITEEPGPVAVERRGPGRPRKEARTNAGPSATPPTSSPDVGERPRRIAAIRAEENMRKGRDRGPEAWPLLQARADRRRLQQRN
jgi:hypothetical protein